MKKKIIEIDTWGVLKHRYSDLEIHLHSKHRKYAVCLPGYQVFFWKLLGFDYIEGADYVDLIKERHGICKTCDKKK